MGQGFLHGQTGGEKSFFIKADSVTRSSNTITAVFDISGVVLPANYQAMATLFGTANATGMACTVSVGACNDYKAGALMGASIYGVLDAKNVAGSSKLIITWTTTWAQTSTTLTVKYTASSLGGYAANFDSSTLMAMLVISVMDTGEIVTD